MIAKALTIAGSDSGGCAGIQADLKTFFAHDVFGTSVITALTSQNTLGVTHIMPATVESIATQIDAVLSDIGTGAVKTGMLFSKEIIATVAERLTHWGVQNLVVDPVMVASSGAVLLQDEAVHEMTKKLFPLARLITPNIPEAELLVKREIKTLQDVREACKRLSALGARSVLLKGGHGLSDASGKAIDIWYDGKSFYEFSEVFINTKNLHGTGCTYSAAIAAYIAKGHILEESIRRAKIYTFNAIKAGTRFSIGKGNGPVDHLWERSR